MSKTTNVKVYGINDLININNIKQEVNFVPSENNTVIKTVAKLDTAILRLTPPSKRDDGAPYIVSIKKYIVTSTLPEYKEGDEVLINNTLEKNLANDLFKYNKQTVEEYLKVIDNIGAKVIGINFNDLFKPIPTLDAVYYTVVPNTIILGKFN